MHIITYSASPFPMAIASPSSSSDVLASYLERAEALASLPKWQQRQAADELDEDVEEEAYGGQLDICDSLDAVRAAIYTATGYRYEYAQEHPRRDAAV
jgi:hypothetical protein